MAESGKINKKAIINETNNMNDMSNDLLLMKQRLADSAQQAVDYGIQLGATAVEVSGGYNKGFNLNIRSGAVDTLEHDASKDLSVTVFIDQRRGSATTSDLSRAGLNQAVQAAYNFAKYAGEDPFLSLPDPDQLVRPTSQVDCQLYHPWTISIDEAIELALACEQQALNYDQRITNMDAVSVASHHSSHVIANSLGLCAGYAASMHELACIPIATDGAMMETDYDYSVARDPAELWNIERVAHRAAQKTLDKLHAKTLGSFTGPVLFVDHPAISIIGHLVKAASGSSIYKKTSFLVDQLDQLILPEHISILEQPHLLKAVGSSPFDAEGVYTRTKPLIQSGRLATYLLSTYSANQLKLKTTGNCGGVHNLQLSSTQAKPLADIIAGIDKGVMVTSLMGQGVNLVTGNYSQGFSGFYIEQGKIQFPIHEMTVAGNLQQMFQQIIAVGAETDLRSNIQTGALLIDGMTIAGNAE